MNAVGTSHPSLFVSVLLLIMPFEIVHDSEFRIHPVLNVHCNMKNAFWHILLHYLGDRFHFWYFCGHTVITVP
jgi:hypothetical protein